MSADPRPLSEALSLDALRSAWQEASDEARDAPVRDDNLHPAARAYIAALEAERDRLDDALGQACAAYKAAEAERDRLREELRRKNVEGVRLTSLDLDAALATLARVRERCEEPACDLGTRCCDWTHVRLRDERTAILALIEGEE